MLRFHYLVTMLGQTEVLWPLVAFLAIRFLVERDYRNLACWLGSYGAAVLITVGTKLAFLGWGIGIETLDFTGVSGHALQASLVYPLFFFSLGRMDWKHWGLPAAALGFGVAVMVAWSRVAIGVHSVSEVVIGVMAGGAISGWLILRLMAVPLRRSLAIPLAVCSVLAIAWAYGDPPEPHAHGLIVRLALNLSHRAYPYSREELHWKSAAPPHRVVR